MKIHTLEKYWMAASLLLIIAFIGTVTYGAIGPGVTMVGDTGDIIKDPQQPVKSPNFKKPGVYRTGGNTYDVYVIARRFVFRPDPIVVPSGSTVTFHLTSQDVIHGFNAAGTNLNIMAIPGQIAEFKVRFNEPKNYGVVCHEYCGVGHHLMSAQLKVVPKSDFSLSEANK